MRTPSSALCASVWPASATAARPKSSPKPWHALTIRRPRSRYLVGKDSRRMATLAAALPTPVLDTLRRMIGHQPAPGSRAASATTPEATVRT